MGQDLHTGTWVATGQRQHHPSCSSTTSGPTNAQTSQYTSSLVATALHTPHWASTGRVAFCYFCISQTPQMHWDAQSRSLFGTALLQTISFDLHGSDDRAKTCFRISVDFCGLSLRALLAGTGTSWKNTTDAWKSIWEESEEAVVYSSPIEYTNLPFSSAVAGISLFASLLFLVGEPQIWPGDLLVVVAGGVFFWLFLDLPRYYGTKEFHFSICLLAYPNVRTEPSEIGRNRGKKVEHSTQVLFGDSVPRQRRTASSTPSIEGMSED